MAEATQTTVTRLCHVPKHGDASKEIVVCQRDDGALVVVEAEAGSDRAKPLRVIEFEEALRTAEHVLAGNATALTWPPALTILAAAYLSSVAYSERRMAAESEPNAGGENAQ